MNGHDEEAMELAYGPEYDEWLASLEDYPMIPDTVECPFCGHALDERGGTYRCDNCELTWLDKREVDADRVEPRDEPSDADLFDRGMRVGTAGWAWGMR